jgi:hypothetical protein
MKTIIAGTRTFTNYGIVCMAMSEFGEDVTEVVSGCACGVDTLGEMWAQMRRIPIKRFHADWKLYGKSAGMIRNREMARYGEALVAIWDGHSDGTCNMIYEARERGLLVHVHYIQDEPKKENNILDSFFKKD